MVFVSVLNRLCDVKHVKSTHKRFQTEWKEHEWGGGGGQGGVRLVTVEIARQHIKNFKGKLERFNNRIPLVACLLDIEKRSHCEI